MLAATAVRFAHARRQLLVLIARFRQHIQRDDAVGVIVQRALQPRNPADRAQRHAADLPHASCDLIPRILRAPWIPGTIERLRGRPKR